MTTYFAKHLFDGVKIHDSMLMTVTEGRIVSINGSLGDGSEVDVKLDGLVAAGFIDTQVNGGGGVLFNYQQSPAALQQMMQGHARFGTTSMLPTLITDSNAIMHNAAEAISQAIVQQTLGIVGVHFEGPHLSLPKKGIHSATHVRSMCDSSLATFTRKDLGKVLVTLAPENVPSDIIKDLVDHGVIVALGHSAADIDTVLAAIDAGASGFTHLFNAMSGLTAREPGLIAAALGDKRVTSGLIADLHHVHAYNCKLAYQCIGAKRLMLVTDAMAHVGSDMQSLPWLDSKITLGGDKLTLEDGSLAGSYLNMASAVRNMHSLLNESSDGTSLVNVLNMASQVPANFLGLDDIGQLQAGKKANFVLLDEQLQPQACWINGNKI